MRQSRVVVHIDEDLCNGCGECVPNCAEGAIQIIDGKARLVGDNLCDGLGACLGHCPLGAITLEERDAAAFDEAAVEQHLGRMARVSGGCPGLRTWDLDQVLGGTSAPPAGAVAPPVGPRPAAPTPDAVAPGSVTGPGLRNFPVQLHLVNPASACFRDADLLVAADCVAFAMPGFHPALVGPRTVVIGCPKLDDADAYVDKLAAIFRLGRPRTISVARMDVPCCGGLAQIVRVAQAQAGTAIPTVVTVVDAEGRVI